MVLFEMSWMFSFYSEISIDVKCRFCKVEFAGVASTDTVANST